MNGGQLQKDDDWDDQAFVSCGWQPTCSGNCMYKCTMLYSVQLVLLPSVESPLLCSACCAGAAADSSSDSDSDADVVASDEDDFVNTAKQQQQQQQRKPLPGSAAAAAAASTSPAAATSSGGAAAGTAIGHGPPTEAEQAAVLEWLRKEVARAGGSLGDGWKVQLSGRRPAGGFKSRKFVAPDGTVCYTAPQVKRHLGLEQQPGGEPSLLVCAFNAVVWDNKRFSVILLTTVLCDFVVSDAK
jgi:hypothetical protein